MQGGSAEGPERGGRPRCAQHGLALGPAGQCVLCRREQTAAQLRPLAAPGEGEAHASGWGRVASGVLALGMIASLAWLGGIALRDRASGTAGADAPPSQLKQLQPATSTQTRTRAQQGTQTRAQARTQTQAQAGQVRAATERSAQQPADPAAVPSHAGAQPAQAAAPGPAPENAPGSNVAKGPETLPQQSPDAPDPALAAQAAEDQRRHEQIMAAIAERERAHTAASVAITMYSTSWCGACKAARQHMQSHGIAFVDRDVEHDPEAKAQQLALNPSGSVPTIDVDGKEVLIGFNARRLEAAIAHAVAARTGS